MDFGFAALGIDEIAGDFRSASHEMNQQLRERLKDASTIVERSAEGFSISRRVRAAMSYDVTVKSPFEFEARVGPTRKKAFFAHFLEFGTSHSRAFPFLAPAMGATEDQVVGLVGKPFAFEGRHAT